jgi:molybdopterin/thiamine biosynthesis adenylyltransferase
MIGVGMKPAPVIFVKNIMHELSETQRNRYSRHLMLSEIGESGQKKLLEARVLVVGLGGLGSPISYYLSAAGVGCLGIIDSDVVDISNLQRQIIHSTDTIGMPKVLSAKQTINRLNPDVKVITYQDRLTDENSVDIVQGYDVVVDASDNFQARYVINDACLASNKPYVHGSIFQFEGMATVFFPKEGPCYRCLYPTPPPEWILPGPTDIGLLGVLPGVIGTIEATETIKLILGIGETLKGKLLIYDALNMEFQTLEVKVNPGCGRHNSQSML